MESVPDRAPDPRRKGKYKGFADYQPDTYAKAMPVGKAGHIAFFDQEGNVISVLSPKPKEK
jgi:hypothetical protein